MKNRYLENCCTIETALDGVSFYRQTMKAGETLAPNLDPEKLIVLLFNGGAAYIQVDGELFTFSEPSVFVPDFDHSSYMIQAIEDLEFVMCVFTMNEWDKTFFKGWNLHLPFFSRYSDGVRFRHIGRSENLGSWSLIQPFQLGHLSLSVIYGKDGIVESDGNPLQNQWLYAVDGSQYRLSINNGPETTETAGSFQFIPVQQPYRLQAEKGMPIYYFNIEYFTEANLQKNYLAQIFNGRMTETK